MILLVANIYAIVYYRSIFNDPNNKNINALKMTGFVILVYCVLGVTMYYVDGSSSISYDLMTFDFSNLDYSEENISYFASKREDSRTVYYETPSGFLAAFLSPMIILSAVIFSIYVGAGMAFLPFDLIQLYNNKPKKPDPMRHIYTKKVLMSRAEDLLTQGKEIYDLKQNIMLTPSENAEEIKTKKNLLQAGINDLKEDMVTYNDMLDIYRKEENIVDVNPLTYVLYLILGIIGFVISILYLLHNLLGIKGIDIVLERFLDSVKVYSPLISLFIFLTLCFTTLITAIHGFYRFSYLSTQLTHGYPVAIDGTWTDTFLININMLLLVTIGNVLYYTQSVSIYFVCTDAYTLVGTILGNFKLHNKLRTFGLYNILFILIFLLSLFSYFFIKSPHEMLNKIVKERLNSSEQEKQALLKSQAPE